MVLDIPIDMKITSNRGYLSISWSAIEMPEFLRFDLVRKKASVPAHYFDGKKIYSGDDLGYKDYDIKNGSIYYYRLFIVINNGENFNTDYLSTVRCIVKSMAFTNDAKSYGEQLYKTLPDQVLADDSRSNQNMPLLRYFNLIFHEFDKLDVLSGSILDQLDIENCDEVFLPYHAKWLGLEYDRNFDVTTNRLLLSSWKEVQPYQGTETGVKYLLRKVFKSDVTIFVDTVVNINVITLFIDDSRYWMINHVDKINKMIKRFLALRTKYDLIIKLGALDEDYDRDNLLDEHIVDFISFNAENENYNNTGQLNNEEYRLSSTLFWSDKVENRIIDELFDILSLLDEEVYELSKPSVLGNADCLLSDSLYFSTVSRESDILKDLLTTLFAESYDKLQKNEYLFDAINETLSERYDRTPLISSPDFLLSDDLLFADGVLKILDEFSDSAMLQDNEIYVVGLPALSSDEYSLLSSTMIFSNALRENVDRLFDTINFNAVDELFSSYKMNEENLDSIIENFGDDEYDKTSRTCDERYLLSSTMLLGCGLNVSTEYLDVVISDEKEETYSLDAPSILSLENNLLSTSFVFSIAHTRDTETLSDNISAVDEDFYSGAIDVMDSTIWQDLGNDNVYRESTLTSSSFLLGTTFVFGIMDAYIDELQDSVTYIRPVGLFSTADALLSSSMFVCDNLL